MLKTPGWLQADYLSILLDLFPSSSSFPPLLGSRQTRSRSSPPRGHLAHPPRGHVPAISLASFSLLLTPFFLASSRLSIKTIVFLTGRAAFQTCGTQENKPSFLRKCQTQGLCGREGSGPPPSEWSKRRTERCPGEPITLQLEARLRDGRASWRQQSLAMLGYLGSRMPHAANIRI